MVLSYWVTCWDTKMMRLSLSKDYRSALRVALLLQVVFGIIAFKSMKDLFLNDLFLYVWWRAIAAYWGCFIVMVFSRPNTPTKVDLFLVKWGFFLLLFITPVLSVLMWQHLWRPIIYGP